MSFMTATLTAAEIHAVSDPTKTHEVAIHDLDQIIHSLGADPDSFIESLRVKNTLDAYVQRARLEPTVQVLTVILNCEYKLWKVDEKIPLRRKPYLSHWVEALEEINEEVAEEKEDKVTSKDATATLTAEDIRRTRANYIIGLLSKPVSAKASPQTVLENADRDGVSLASFDLMPYMRMLVETEVWDKLPEPKVRALEQSAQTSTAIAKDNISSGKAQAQKVNSAQSWDEAILRKLKDEPEQAVQELAHLPLELSSLDFLTKLHANHTFENHGINGQDVSHHFIQHAMRLIEKMEAPPPTSQQETITNGTTNGVGNGTPIHEYGKDAQRRAVMILLLFIKSLIAKGFVEAGLLFYELQEICIRYVWIKEVREFRAWAQGHVGS
jgi:hypothetical protein